VGKGTSEQLWKELRILYTGSEERSLLDNLTLAITIQCRLLDILTLAITIQCSLLDNLTLA
jgi:hypothetical protein